ncbi:hypothetical protein FRC12_011961 [Ceratobasidium sp. 428]|nr:hypothetical protein FRC12_011961 [Ceratobasidium sp. 428]
MFSTLTYPVEQPYRLRWITEIFYGSSIILIILLVLLNLILGGYDSVTVLISDPNVTDYEQWWAPKSLPSALKIHTKPGECEEARLPQSTPLRTNSSLPLFSYFVSNNFNQYDSPTNTHGLRGETAYKANPLDICRVQDMSLTMEPRILSFNVDTTLLCAPVGEPPRPREFRTSFKRADSPRFRPDSILQYMSYTASPNETDSEAYRKVSREGPPRDPYLNVLGVVDMMGSDLIRTMWMRKVTWFSVNDTANQSPVPELGSMSWDSEPDGRSPTDPSRLSWRTYTEGYWYDGNYVRTINATIVNVFVAVRDAINLDIGYVTPTNIYVNKTSFNSMITRDGYFPVLTSLMSTYYPDDVGHGACSWGWGCSPGFNTSWAQALTSTDQPVNNLTLPITLPSPLPPSVIDMVYLCPQYQLKSWGSLLLAIFTGVFTMYVTAYEVFAWIAPPLDRKYKGPQPWEKFMTQRSSEPLGPPDYSPDSGYDDKEHLLGDQKDRAV